jgi:hypothetical protein
MFINKFKFLLLLVTISLINCSCKFDSPPLSKEGQIKAYAVTLATIYADSSPGELEEEKQFKEYLGRVSDSFERKDVVYLAELIEKRLVTYTRQREKLEAMKPPESFGDVHVAVVRSSIQSEEILRQFARDLQTGDRDQVVQTFQTLRQNADEVSAAVETGLKKAGLSANTDWERVVTTPKTPLAWYWALPLLFIGAALLVGLLQLFYFVAMLPILPLGLATAKMWEQRKFPGALVAGSFVFCSAFVVCTLIGVVLGSSSEWLMWPRTQLAPWFVYLFYGWGALGFFSRGSDREGESDVSTLIGFAMGIFCLAGFIFCTAFKSSLFGPWLWVHERF